MTAVVVTPVADLATDLERLAELFNAGMDKYEVSCCLQSKIPGLFGEDLWDAWLPYAAAVKRVDAFQCAGLDAHAQTVQRGAAETALKVLLDAAAPTMRQEVRSV